MRPRTNVILTTEHTETASGGTLKTLNAEPLHLPILSVCSVSAKPFCVFRGKKKRTRQARPSRIQARLSICANPQDSPFLGGTGLSRPQSLPRVRSSTIGRAGAWPSHMHLWPVHNAFCVFRGRFSTIALHAIGPVHDVARRRPQPPHLPHGRPSVFVQG